MKRVFDKFGNVVHKSMFVRIPRNTERSDGVEQPQKAYGRWPCQRIAVDRQGIKISIDALNKQSCDGCPTTVADNINGGIAISKIAL